jgi:hypothetical protein
MLSYYEIITQMNLPKQQHLNKISTSNPLTITKYTKGNLSAVSGNKNFHSNTV